MGKVVGDEVVLVANHVPKPLDSGGAVVERHWHD